MKFEKMEPSRARVLTVRVAAPYLLAVGLLVLVGVTSVVDPLLSILCLVSFLVVAGSLWVGRGKRAEAGLGEDLPRASQTRLWTLMDEAAGSAGAKKLASIRLVDGVRADMVVDTWLSGLVVRRRRLEISLSLFGLLDVAELRALMVSLFAQRTGHTARLQRVYESIGASLDRVAGRSVARFYRRYYEPVVGAIAEEVSQRVLAGDRVGAEVVSRGTMIGALSRLHMGADAHDMFVREYVTPMLALGLRPENYFEGLRAFGKAPERVSQFEATHLALRDVDPGRGADVTMADRLRILESMPADERAEPFSEASEGLLADRAVLERSLSAAVAKRTTGRGDLEAVSWVEYPDRFADIEVIRAVQLAEAAAEVNPMERHPGSLRMTLRAASSVARQDLAERLVPMVKVIPAHERPAVLEAALRNHLRAMIGSALVDHAEHRWSLDWSGSAGLIGPKDVRVDLDMWVDGVLNGGNGLPALFGWFDKIGVPSEMEPVG